MPEQPNFESAPPSHVPPELVSDYDYVHPEGFKGGDNIYAVLKKLHDKPDIFWSPRYGGHWVITRDEDIRWVRSEPILFSRTEFVLPRGTMNTLMPPVNVDPPYHARFRAVVNPPFKPSVIQRMKGNIQDVARELIAKVKPRGRCEFVDEIARILPAVVFFQMLGLPPERIQQALVWARDYVNAKDQETKDRTFGVVAKFLLDVINEREGSGEEDLFSRIATWRKNPRYQSEDEVIGMAATSFFGGLDTTASLTSFTVHHLATHPEARRRILADPAIIPKAAEEYIRRFSLAQSARLVTSDVTRKGVILKQNDMVQVVECLGALDERAWTNPMEVDFDRDASDNDTFGHGVHRCLGEHLARLELQVVIEEWVRAFPDFELDPEVPTKNYSGVVIGVEQLGLRWKI
jgi:cytochrome P450